MLKVAAVRGAKDRSAFLPPLDLSLRDKATLRLERSNDTPSQTRTQSRLRHLPDLHIDSPLYCAHLAPVGASLAQTFWAPVVLA